MSEYQPYLGFKSYSNCFTESSTGMSGLNGPGDPLKTSLLVVGWSSGIGVVSRGPLVGVT